MPILHSKIIGEGKPLLVLHGFLGMADNWKTLGAQFANAGFEAHLIDQRNHGKSFHSENFNYDLLAQDLEFYMAHYGLSKVHLLGHSMGGKTAMQMACSNAEMVDKLIVADIAPKFYPPHHQDIINALNAISVEPLRSRSEANTQLSGYINEIGIRQFLLKNLYWIEKEKLGFRFNLPVLSHKMEEIGENIGSTDTFGGPTLFLRGDRSEYVVQNDIPAIKRHFPKASIETIENAGHWLHAENPKQFLEKSLTFLNC
ncbi:alpha/beta fold hydrolase [Spongiimicrobium sp. 3-5]|uniref:alpha/beta fold hydrolase n=1 Tax=Spongiimicrobium sp. 3-5 TaxID=3332596 RepID=UPI00397FC75E